MNLNDLLKSGKKIIPNLIDNKEIISKILSSNLPMELIRNRQLIIPKEVIEKELLGRTFDNNSITIKEVSCNEDKIVLTLEIKKKAVSAILFVPFKINEGVIGNEKQIISFIISDEKLIGANLLGKIAVNMAKLFVKDIIKDGVNRSGLESVVNFEETRRILTIDLSSQDAIKKLNACIAKTKFSVLDFITLRVCHHTNGIKILAERNR
jgi:hypothetical protein